MESELRDHYTWPHSKAGVGLFPFAAYEDLSLGRVPKIAQSDEIPLFSSILLFFFVLIKEKIRDGGMPFHRTSEDSGLKMLLENAQTKKLNTNN